MALLWESVSRLRVLICSSCGCENGMHFRKVLSSARILQYVALNMFDRSFAGLGDVDLDDVEFLVIVNALPLFGGISVLNECGLKNLSSLVVSNLHMDDEEEVEGNFATFRVSKQYDNAMVINLTPEEAQQIYEEKYNTGYEAWKVKYYLDKFPEWPEEQFDSEVVRLCENYVQGLQWVLYYYYRGIASWPWYYQYHYSPLTSGMISFSFSFFFLFMLLFRQLFL